jgi:hypothetical protein
MISKEVIEVAEKLAERYETISLEEIKEAFKNYPEDYPHRLSEIKEGLTGFGSWHRCNLCRVAYDCDRCLYAPYKCYRSAYSESYYAIEQAETPEELLLAYRERAKVIRARIEELNKDEE